MVFVYFILVKDADEIKVKNVLLLSGTFISVIISTVLFLFPHGCGGNGYELLSICFIKVPM